MGKRKQIVAKKCDRLNNTGIWPYASRCPGVAVLVGRFEDGHSEYLCIAHGRQARWQGLDGEKVELSTIEPFPTLQDALDVIVGVQEDFISLACKDGEHDTCRIDYGSRVCVCDCNHEFNDDDFEEETEQMCTCCEEKPATDLWDGAPVCSECADAMDEVGG